jgi:hypothetical protein
MWRKLGLTVLTVAVYACAYLTGRKLGEEIVEIWRR